MIEDCADQKCLARLVHFIKARPKLNLENFYEN